MKLVVCQKRKSFRSSVRSNTGFCKVRPMYPFHLLFCAALTRAASIVKFGAQPDAGLDVLRSAYNHAIIIQPGTSDFNSSNSSTPHITVEAPRNASSAQLGSVPTCLHNPPLAGHPSYTSCLDSLNLIPRESRLRQFRSRAFLPIQPTDLSAPYRFLSCQ